ncbi:S-layer homology domain-containing protein [Bacillus sp. FJAT-26390]|uniref:S-layer homology domain-containing protein n=1 Tax=Bacillus sp. FJAT-26390 TaxID=1743142 RepID=UPI000807C3A2|nr:S-layer homology domain-containing protein [Bacillus sp. FJAT-26390]OBZ09957.1 hypothetical protein A7975_21505 [Bacillus sp. FJAT-26390]
MREKSNSLFKQNSQQPHVFRGGEIKVMKKKIAAFVLAAALVLPTSLTAFAATPSDVVGKPQQSAIEELSALGIIKGYEDGTFKPDNKITRAELAKIVVEATGSGGAATLMQSVKSTFKDVKTNQWYTGYINVAATKGYIQGFNGNFRPSDNIKFEEVTAILTRALGYKDAKLPGAWPYNVLVKAEDLGLFSKVEITPGTLATRAIVAQITSNTLQKELVAYNADGDQYNVVKEGKNVILISKLGSTIDRVLTAGSLDSKGQVELNDKWESTAANFIVTGGKKLSQLIGRDVVALLDKNGKVLALTDAQASENTVTGTLNAAPTVSGADAGKVFVKVGSDVKSYTVNTVASTTYGVTDFFKNGDVVAVENRGTIASGATVNVYLNKDGSARAVVAKEYNPTNALFVSYVAKTASSDARITHTGGFSIVNDNTVVTINGEVKAVTDLAADDVLEVARNSKSVASEVNATRNVVTGKVTNISQVNSDTFYTVNGEKYKAIGVTLVNGGEYKLFLNKDKAIVKFTVVTPGAADNNLAIVLGYTNDAKVIVDGILADRDVLKYYSVKEDKIITVNLDVAKNYTAQIGEFVTLTFDGSTVTGIDTSKNAGNIETAVTTVDAKSDTSLTLKNGTTTRNYAINGNTVVLDATGVLNAGKVKSDAKVVKGDIAKVTKADVAFVVTDASGYNATYIVLIKDLEAAENALPTVAGKFVSVSKNTADTVSGSTYSVTLNVNGTDKEIAIQGVVYDALNGKKADNNVIVKLYDKDNGDGTTASTKYDGVTVVYEKTATANNNFTAANLNYNTFEVSGLTGSYALSANSVVYVIDKDNNVVLGSIADVVAAQLAGDAGDNAYNVFVADTEKFLGNNKEVSVLVIKKG